MNRTMKKITDFITKKYGSVYAFKVLKYFLENMIARERDGFAVYELCYNVSPSEVLFKDTLIEIVCLADNANKEDAEAGLDLLIEKEILLIDKETGILELKIPIDAIANVYLKETDARLEVVSDKSSANVILLPTTGTELKPNHDDVSGQHSIIGVPDLLYLDEYGRPIIGCIKFYD